MNDTLTLAIIGHLVGDYLLQNDRMANMKKQPGTNGALMCLIHAFTWMWMVGAFTGWGWMALVPLCYVHYWQDRTPIVAGFMKWNGQMGFLTGPCAPWSAIVVDNVFHILQLWFAWRFLA